MSLYIYLVVFEQLWGYSSVGRAPALQAGGQEFESPYLHWTAAAEKRTGAVRRTLKTTHQNRNWETSFYRNCKRNQFQSEENNIQTNLFKNENQETFIQEPYPCGSTGAEGQANKSAGWMPWH